MRAPATVYFLGLSVVVLGGWRIMSSFSRDTTPAESARVPESLKVESVETEDNAPVIMGRCGISPYAVRVYYAHPDGTSSAITYPVTDCGFDDDAGIAIINGVRCVLRRSLPAQSESSESGPVSLQEDVMGFTPVPSPKAPRSTATDSLKETIKQGFFRLPHPSS